MANQSTDPRSVERLAEALRKFLPSAGDPPEPYWVIVGVNANGDATGDLWGEQPRTVAVFSTRELGAAALKLAGTPSPEPQIRTVRWEVRGLSKEALALLQGEPTLAPREGVEIQGGKLVTRAL